MNKIEIKLFLLVLFFTSCKVLFSQVANPMLPYEKSLSDKKSPFLPDGFVSFVIQGNLSFDAASGGYNIPNNHYIDNSSMYVLRSNSNKLFRVTARLDQDMPLGAHLKLSMTPPMGAQSKERILTSIDQNILTNIPKGDYNEFITYTFWYDAETAPQQINRRIVFTIQEN